MRRGRGVFDRDCGRFEQGRIHLARHETAPDQRVEFQLGRIQERTELVRGQIDVGRADRLVRGLRVRLGLVDVGFLRDVVVAERRRDVGAARGLRLDRDVHRVGSHVGDEADGAVVERDAFIELLRGLHGLVRGEPHGGAGGLLERACDERRRSELAAGRSLLVGDMPRGCIVDELAQGFRLLLVGNVGVLAVDLREFRAEGPSRRGFRMEQRFEDPVFLRDERQDFAFAFADQAECHGLHASGADAAFDARPQQRADLVSDDAVEHAARLLGVHAVHVDLAGRLERAVDGAAGDLVEGDAVEVRLLVDPAQDFLQVPRDGFPFAVRVRRQIDVDRVLRGGLEFAEVVAARLAFLVLRREVVFDVDAERVFGQVADVTHRGLDDVFGRQDAPDRTRFRGGFHDNQLFAHAVYSGKCRDSARFFPYSASVRAGLFSLILLI